MDMDTLKESLSGALKIISDSTEVSAENLAEMRKRQEELLTIIVKVEDIFGDGLQLIDIVAIGRIIPDIMMLVKDLDWAGSDKRQFVLDAVWLVYKTIDTYPDGKHNNINIPILAGSWETRAERIFLNFAAGMAIDAAFDGLRRDGEV